MALTFSKKTEYTETGVVLLSPVSCLLLLSCPLLSCPPKPVKWGAWGQSMPMYRPSKPSIPPCALLKSPFISESGEIGERCFVTLTVAVIHAIFVNNLPYLHPQQPCSTCRVQVRFLFGQVHFPVLTSKFFPCWAFSDVRSWSPGPWGHSPKGAEALGWNPSVQFHPSY